MKFEYFKLLSSRGDILTRPLLTAIGERNGLWWLLAPKPSSAHSSQVIRHWLSQQGFGPSSKVITSKAPWWTMNVLANFPYSFYYPFRPAVSQCVFHAPGPLLPSAQSKIRQWWKCACVLWSGPSRHRCRRDNRPRLSFSVRAVRETSVSRDPELISEGSRGGQLRRSTGPSATWPCSSEARFTSAGNVGHLWGRNYFQNSTLTLLPFVWRLK